MPQLFDRRLIQAQLEADRAWSAYALADLDSAYFPFTSWFCAEDHSAIALVYRAFARTIVLYVGRPRGVSKILDETDHSLDGLVEFYGVVKPEILPLLAGRYEIGEERPMLRMMLDAPRFQPVRGEAARLNPGHLGSVRSLYEDEPPDFFSADMLGKGIYYGIYEGNDLVAIAGTHIVAPDFGIGALGNIHTRRDRRGLGYATRVTSAVTRDLLALGIPTIVLNVRKENDTAVHVYERLGFQTYCEYYEVIAGRCGVGVNS